MKIITREDSLFDGFVKDGIEAAPKLVAYSMAGRHSCLSGQVSKSTVCRSVRDAEVRAEIGPSFAPAAAIHLQVDEKEALPVYAGL
ncbi:MAG: hypothetical protein IJ787_03750 [Bacilli bacterium]|nr:hypothetical protein [Bacilli bacterium]